MAALFTFLLSLCAILLVYFLYDFGQKSFLRETEAAIDNEIENILSITHSHNQRAIASIIKHRSSTESHPIYYYEDKNGIFLSGNINSAPKKTSLIKEGIIGFIITINGKERRVAAKIHTFLNGSRLLVARDIHDIIASYEKLQTFSVFIILFMLIVVLISFFISNFVVSRINNISNTARQIINTGDLSKRITIDSSWDDLSYLSETLNQLFAKIESLMISVKQVSDNIAHDLKTPITRLRGDLESLKGKKLSNKDISKMVDEADRILSVFNSLLRIANIEKGKSQEHFSKVDIDSLLNDVIELYEPFAQENEVKIVYSKSSKFIFYSDKDLIFQMFANLIDNAIKFSPKDSTIDIEINKKNDKIIVKIADHGIGLDNKEHEKVFERFYRTDKSRNKQGNGLGLSMVKAIAKLHKADITLSDNNPGLIVTISLPHEITT